MKHALKLRSLLKIAGPIIAVRFRWAAQRDERNGFPLTAAMEWRKAAEVSEPITLLADHCWREWERLMRLPRHLAAAIGVASVAQLAPAEACAMMTPHSAIQPNLACEASVLLAV
jgi:hypothetical protein